MSRADRDRRASGADAGHVIPGRQPVREALAAGRGLTSVVLDLRMGEDLEQIAGLARDAGVEVRTADRAAMDAMTGEVHHQGAIAVAPSFAYTPLAAMLGADLLVVLDGVTDVRNLGAIARAAEQVGAGGLVIRTRRAASPGPAAEKASAGALSWLPVAQVPNIVSALATMADAGMWSVGLTGDGRRSIWEEPLLDGRVAVVVGDEGPGLSRLVAERVDALVSIPMSGHLDSLNASTAVAVTLFEWARRRHA